MTPGLWALVIAGIGAACIVARDALGRKQAAAREHAAKKAGDRTAYLTVKQRAMGKRLRRQGRSLLSGKEYVPALTKKAEQPESVIPANVVRLKAKGGKRA